MKTHIAAVVAVLALSGCKISASATGSVKTGGEANADADAAVTAEAEAPEPASPAQDEGITYKEGHLDYEGTINFEYDKAALQTDDTTESTLKEFVVFLQKHADVTIEIEGHTDSRGSDDYNRDLSDRRAASVREWLIEKGIDEERLTAIGKGEDDPSVAEPPECDDKKPADASTCEGPWAINRRVVFEVTGGGETLEKPEPAPEPAPEPIAEPAPPPEECPWLYGGHANALGPNAWLGLAGAIQPGVCWLEPSLGLSLGFGGLDAKEPPANTSGDARFTVLNVPLRMRVWFMDRHAVIGDLGLGLSQYWISGDMTDSAGVTAEYKITSTELYGHLGAGYGFRPNRSLAGWRLGIVVGALIPIGNLAASEITAPAGFNAAEGAAIQAELDADADGLTDLEPYGEVSFGWLF